MRTADTQVEENNGSPCLEVAIDWISQANRVANNKLTSENSDSFTVMWFS